MAKHLFRAVLPLVFLCIAGGTLTADPTSSTKTPLDATRLLSLVAGNCLPENVVAEIKVRGLAFRPSDEYRTRLTQAGATPQILQAVNRAALRAGVDADDAKNQADIWGHLAAAGQRIREKKFDDAEKELNDAIQSGSDKLDAGFIMGEDLRQQERWDMAISVYQEILRRDTRFPEAHTKLSYVLYRSGDGQSALREAKAALVATPNNPEARKDAGLALMTLQRFDAALAEYNEALRLKPDYENIHYDLGLLLYGKNDLPGSVVEYKKALALNPNDVNARINLALSYSQLNDNDSAVRELREAKRIAPNDIVVRQDLGSLLLQLDMLHDAILELRELEAIAPESAICHQCLGGALYQMQDYDAAIKEYQIAMRLAPQDASPLRDLGRVYEAQEKYDLALATYRDSLRLDPDSADAHLCIGRVLLLNKQPQSAVDELRRAADIEPANPQVHEQYGKALESLGDLAQAKSEYQQSLLLDKDNAFALLDLAHLLEQQGDWPAAMETYRAASKKVQEAVVSMRGASKVIVDAPGAYQAAKLRLQQHLADLRAAGKSDEAAELEARIASATASKGLSGKLDAAIEAGSTAANEQRFDDAFRNYSEAIKLAEQIRPPDARLVISLGALGALYYMRKDLAHSRETFEHQLKVATEIYGPDSPQLTHPLDSVCHVAVEQGDYPRAESLAQKEIAINEKTYGANSVGYSVALLTMARVYQGEKQYAKAVPFAENAVKLHEKLSPTPGPMILTSRRLLCSLYDSLLQSENAAACDAQLLPVMEYLYGPNNTALAPVLTSEVKAFRALGRQTEADAAENRLKNLQQSSALK